MLCPLSIQATIVVVHQYELYLEQRLQEYGKMFKMDLLELLDSKIAENSLEQLQEDE